MSDNPFRPRPEFKKRLVNVSLTGEQHQAFEELRERLGFDTAGALIKHALAELADDQNRTPDA